MARGRYTPAGKVSKFGYVGDVDSGDTGDDVWIVDGGYTGFVSAAATTNIVSSSADDTAAGAGAQSVSVLGLVVNGGVWVETTETVELNGTAPVTLSNEYIRVYRAYVDVAGTSGLNAGNIDVLHGSTILARVAAGFGQTLQACYTVPDVLQFNADISECAITRWYATIGASQAAYATVALQTKDNDGAWRTRRIAGIGEGGWMVEHLEIPIIVMSQTDIRIRIIDNGVNGSSISAGFDLELW